MFERCMFLLLLQGLRWKRAPWYMGTFGYTTHIDEE